MKRSKQGYVLVLVMVVTLVLCSIASIIAATVSNNLSNGVIVFSKKQLDYEVRGLAEQYLVRLDSLDGTTETIPYDPDNPDYEIELSNHIYSTIDQVRNNLFSQDNGFLVKDNDAEPENVVGAESVVYQSDFGARKYRVDIYDAEYVSANELSVMLKVNKYYLDEDDNPHEELLLTTTAKIAITADIPELDDPEEADDPEEVNDPEEYQCTVNYSVCLSSYIFP